MTDVDTTTTTKKPSVVEESSQYQHWRFSPQQLWDIRNERTKEAIDRVKRNMKEEMVFYKTPSVHAALYSHFVSLTCRLQARKRFQLRTQSTLLQTKS